MRENNTVYPQKMSHDVKFKDAEKQDRDSDSSCAQDYRQGNAHGRARRELGMLNGWKRHKIGNQKFSSDHRRVHRNEDAQRG